MLDDVKNALDAISLTTVAGAIAGVLPSIAVTFSIIWTGMRIVEGGYKFYKWLRQ